MRGQGARVEDYVCTIGSCEKAFVHIGMSALRGDYGQVIMKQVREGGEIDDGDAVVQKSGSPAAVSEALITIKLFADCYAM